LPYATGSAGLAITVRGSSRRIMIMRFRPANIRLINRRLKLLRLLLALSSRKRKDNYKNISTDFAELTRSLHIKAMRSSSHPDGPMPSACGPVNRLSGEVLMIVLRTASVRDGDLRTCGFVFHHQ